MPGGMSVRTGSCLTTSSTGAAGGIGGGTLTCHPAVSNTVSVASHSHVFVYSCLQEGVAFSVEALPDIQAGAEGAADR